jgi:hypothetical protein
MKRTFDDNLANYFRYCSVLSNAHYDMAEIYRRRHRKLGFYVVIGTSVVSAAAFGTIAKEVPAEWRSWAQIGTGIVSVLATVLASLQTFLGFSEMQANHKRGADGYSEVRRDIDLALMKFPDAMVTPSKDAVAALEGIKKRLDDLDKTSPTIPDDVYDTASAKTPNAK